MKPEISQALDSLLDKLLTSDESSEGARKQELHREDRKARSLWIRVQGGEEQWRGNELVGLYRGENAVSNFLENILWEEEEIRKSLAFPKQIKWHMETGKN